VLVFAGGIIPEADVGELRRSGIDAIFLPGAATGEIVRYLKERLAA
jgi:methylmalonyl-CoA mutase C-terminal domain/subunit